MIRGNRPSIDRTGTVTHRGGATHISGWQLGLCATRCDCHRHPQHGHLAILEEDTVGSIGLVSHRPDCTCCQPWTWNELEDILRDIADLAALAHA